MVLVIIDFLTFSPSLVTDPDAGAEKQPHFLRLLAISGPPNFDKVEVFGELRAVRDQK